VERAGLAPASDAEAAHARGRIAYCLFGFAFLDDLLDSPAFPVASVDPQVLEGMRGMSAAARRATRAAEPLRDLAAGGLGAAGCELAGSRGCRPDLTTAPIPPASVPASAPTP
jgi:hypothetical protein